MSRVSIGDAMGHNIYWDNDDKTVVLQEYTGDVTKDDLYNLARKSAEMLNSVSQTVHLILDERKSDLMLDPKDMIFLQKLTPKNQGAVVMIVMPARAKYKTALQNLGKQIGPDAFAQPYFADSIEAARQFLQESFGVRYESKMPEESSDPPII
jgi:hypothetical protein